MNAHVWKQVLVADVDYGWITSPTPEVESDFDETRFKDDYKMRLLFLIERLR